MSTSPTGRRLGRLPGATGRRIRAGVLLVGASWREILQSTVAASVAYALALGVGHEEPFFAPIAAVATVAVSLGNRLRRSSELVMANAVGIAFADLVVARIGTGAWQLGVLVAMALVGALLLGGGPILIMQTSSAAVFIATTAPPSEGPFWNTGRFLDALIGGAVGLVVAAFLLPVDPVRHTQQGTKPLLQAISGGLQQIALALREADARSLDQALAKFRDTGKELAQFQAGIDATKETVRIAPWYWGQRTLLLTYELAGFHLENAVRNCRVLARQAAVACDRTESVATNIPDALDRMASTFAGLADVLAGESPEAARAGALDAVWLTTLMPASEGLFVAPMVAQIRLLASDLLQATGMGSAQAAALIRTVDPQVPSLGS